MNGRTVDDSDLTYSFRAVGVARLGELREDLDGLVRSDRMSGNETFRGYLDGLSFEVPADLPSARSVIVLAIPTKLMRVRFHLNGEAHDLMMPPQYYHSGVSAEGLRNSLLKNVVGDRGRVVVRSDNVQLKPLAVRSGLAAYGRNNICFVDGMGSLLTLHAYFTDADLDEDEWREVTFMDTCESCDLCMRACPCGCISEANPVVDVGKCVTLFNEVSGVFPDSLGSDAHNALMGCMGCQLCCPSNREPLRLAGRLEDVSERETLQILDGTPDEELLESLTRKLRGFPPATSEDYFPIFTRNLRALLVESSRGNN